MNKSIRDINRVYERLYSINENLSAKESKELLRGFEDGINEGWRDFVKGAAKMAGNVVKTGRDAVGIAKDTVKDTYQQGKDLAKKVWGSVADFSKEVKDTVSRGLSSAASYIASAPGKAREAVKSMYATVAEKLKSAYDTMGDKADELKNAIGLIWDDIVNNIKGQVSAVKGKIQDGKEWVNTNQEVLAQNFAEAQESSVEWIKEAGVKGAEVLQKVKSGAIDAAEYAGLFAVGLVVLPVVGLVKGANALNQVGQDAVKAGLEKVHTVWEETKSLAKEGYGEGESSLKRESFTYLKTFESFKY